jgi:hypothetical protein
MKRKICLGVIFMIITAFHELAAAAVVVPYIGVQFVQAGPGLAANQWAGEVPQDNFNLVDTTAGHGVQGTTAGLYDSNGNPTPITLTHDSSDGWNTNTSTGTPNGVLLHGEDKSGPGNTASYSFNNVPNGRYDLIGYIENDIAGYNAVIAQGATTFWVTDAADSGTPAWTLADNTNPAIRITGNFVEFFNITSTSGAISFTDSTGDGTAAFNGLQLLQLQPEIPEPATAVMLVASGAALLARRPRSHAPTHAR